MQVYQLTEIISYKVQARKFFSEPENSQITQDCHVVNLQTI